MHYAPGAIVREKIEALCYAAERELARINAEMVSLDAIIQVRKFTAAESKRWVRLGHALQFATWARLNAREALEAIAEGDLDDAWASSIEAAWNAGMGEVQADYNVTKDRESQAKAAGKEVHHPKPSKDVLLTWLKLFRDRYPQERRQKMAIEFVHRRYRQWHRESNPPGADYAGTGTLRNWLIADGLLSPRRRTVERRPRARKKKD